MPQLVLTVLKYLFIVLLYLFLGRAVRVIYLDLVGPRVPRPASPKVPASEPAKRKRQAPRVLVLTQENKEPQSFPMNDQPITIGRGSTCEVVLDDNYSSQFHARVFPRDGSWFVEDLGSTNGTYLNRVKVSSASPLAAGDEIRIGKTTIEARR
ncbi:MAG: FHA domain-containing protein [Actinobacteria bacterium]|nr:FHA domain-containing protein [Actinomycetota bacterium]